MANQSSWFPMKMFDKTMDKIAWANGSAFKGGV